MNEKDTKYVDLNTTLSAVGKAVFATFYYDFKDISIPEDVLAHKIFTENSASRSDRQNFRIPRARRIFQMGQELDALRIVIQSKRVAPKARDLAKEILNRETLKNKYSQERREEQVFIQELNKEMDCNFHDSQLVPQYNNTSKSPKSLISNTTQIYPRDRKISQNALRMANYLCEVNNDHFVFRRKGSGINYTEPHHLIPLCARLDFPDVDLDREQNIISLCSNCHNFLHYGADNTELLHILYEQRKELLASIGLIISFDELKEYY